MNAQILYQHPLTGAGWQLENAAAACVWTTKASGAPASLELAVLDPSGKVPFANGGMVSLRIGGVNAFLGYVFSVARQENGQVSLKAYDQTRYLKNKETYVFKNKRADEVIGQIASDYGLKTGALENTGYVIPAMVEDQQTLFDIMQKSLDLTLQNTGRRYILWDDYGALCLSDQEHLKTELALGENSLVTGYQYREEIDNATANRVRLYSVSKASGRREAYVAEDASHVGQWGILEYQQQVGVRMNPAQARALGDSLLSQKNAPARSFTVEAAGCDARIRAGASVLVRIPDAAPAAFYRIGQARHDLLAETMSLKLQV